ncbi:MAG: TetR/AcrR family transcriptional regulator [Nocardioides sp.]|nr:TetR/AcrR family transcriptional regulator [Nocardioides sp.]
MRTRDDVLDAALATLNDDPTSSMADIAGALGIARATLHRHFATREALLLEIGERALDRWARTQVECGMPQAVAAGDADALDACLQAILPAFLVDAAVFDFTLTDPTMLAMPRFAARTRALQDLEIAFFEAAQHAGVVRSDVPAAWLSHTLYGLLVAAREATRDGDVARRSLPDLMITTFRQGAAPR